MRIRQNLPAGICQESTEMHMILSLLSIAAACLSIISLLDQIRLQNLPSVPRIFFTLSLLRRISNTRPERIQSSDMTASLSEIGPISCDFMDKMMLMAI
jgi:hypothetical protein